MPPKLKGPIFPDLVYAAPGLCMPECARASHHTPCPETDMAMLGAWVAKLGQLSMRETVDSILSKGNTLDHEGKRKEIK